MFCFIKITFLEKIKRLCKNQNLKDNTVLHQNRCTKKDKPSVM